MSVVPYTTHFSFIEHCSSAWLRETHFENWERTHSWKNSSSISNPLGCCASIVRGNSRSLKIYTIQRANVVHSNMAIFSSTEVGIPTLLANLQIMCFVHNWVWSFWKWIQTGIEERMPLSNPTYCIHRFRISIQPSYKYRSPLSTMWVSSAKANKKRKNPLSLEKTSSLPLGAYVFLTKPKWWG